MSVQFTTNRYLLENNSIKKKKEMNKKTRENLSMIIEVLDLIVTLIGLFI